MGDDLEVSADWPHIEQFRASGGEARRQAFCALYDRHAGSVRDYLLRLTGCPHLAEDLTQEVFLRAYSGLDGFSGRSSFKTWVYQIAINLFRDHLRARKPMAEMKAADLTDPQPGAEWRAQRDEEAHKVRSAVAALPQELRETLILVRFEGMKYREAAEALGITIDAVRMRVHRAHLALVTALTT